MKKVITYGTFDLLHYGHIRLLERAKSLGDYLIVGITSDGFDRTRGKINVQQSLAERIEGVRKTGLADKIVVEEYEGQKIDDILRLGVDIFTVGSDWRGHFDYLNQYCKVVYLERTQGISSTEIRSAKKMLKLGMVGESSYLNKFERESHYVNGIEVIGICAKSLEQLNDKVRNLSVVTSDFQELLNAVDAVYIISNPSEHYSQIKTALESGKHVLCESPLTLNVSQLKELRKLANDKHLMMMDALRTAYSTAFIRMLLLVRSGKIGQVYSVDSICTSLRNVDEESKNGGWNSICSWGPTAMLPIFQLLGTDIKHEEIASHFLDTDKTYDTFTKIAFVYDHAVASLKVGMGVKSEGELIISGTEGYVYVPAPWWKTEYFELRYENPANTRRYYYQLDGEGIREELVTFINSIGERKSLSYINNNLSEKIVKTIEDFYLSNNNISI